RGVVRPNAFEERETIVQAGVEKGDGRLGGGHELSIHPHVITLHRHGLRPRDHMIVKVMKLVKRMNVQYLACVGSTPSIHARIPPFRFFARVNPCSRSSDTAFALLTPD